MILECKESSGVSVYIPKSYVLLKGNTLGIPKEGLEKVSACWVTFVRGLAGAKPSSWSLFYLNCIFNNISIKKWEGLGIPKMYLLFKFWHLKSGVFWGTMFGPDKNHENTPRFMCFCSTPRTYIFYFSPPRTLNVPTLSVQKLIILYSRIIYLKCTYIICSCT